jgi:hypothetical protein
VHEPDRVKCGNIPGLVTDRTSTLNGLRLIVIISSQFMSVRKAEKDTIVPTATACDDPPLVTCKRHSYLEKISYILIKHETRPFCLGNVEVVKVMVLEITNCTLSLTMSRIGSLMMLSFGFRGQQMRVK